MRGVRIGAVGHAVSVMTTQLCLRQVTAAIHNRYINEHGSALVTSYLQKQEACQICPMSRGLPTAPRLKIGNSFLKQFGMNWVKNGLSLCNGTLAQVAAGQGGKNNMERIKEKRRISESQREGREDSQRKWEGCGTFISL